ncbi:uncharacterized protein [Taeniopygia guttata]|uniref:uncharacterized protein isoform X4 n=1 Tax=Taeniopygia guttata TaxID=59729 RepID=UPI003BB8A384
MSRDPRYYEPDPIKAPRAADSAAPPPAPAPPGAAGPAGDTDPPTADAPPAFPLQPRPSTSHLQDGDFRAVPPTLSFSSRVLKNILDS